MTLRRAIAGLGLVTARSIGLSTPAFAQEAGVDVVALGQQVNLLWIVLGALSVIFMPAGFALVETGFCRANSERCCPCSGSPARPGSRTPA